MAPKAVKAAKPETKAKVSKADKPHRAKTSYLHFCADIRDKVARENPGKAFTEIGRILGQMWRDADEKTKAHYKAKFESEKKAIEVIQERALSNALE